MALVPFSVSARAARLIGRENVATSQGAVTELVKNTYDADALACAILFLKRHEVAPPTLTIREYEHLLQYGLDLNGYYDLQKDNYSQKPKLNAEKKRELEAKFVDIVDLWIIDNGNGMSLETIEKHWMVIGTDIKEINNESTGGRTVTGAKGIGRFALDRLGGECELFSATTSSEAIVHWLVDWGDFEGVGKVIGDVTAILESENTSLASKYRDEKIGNLLPKTLPRPEPNDRPLIFDKGTAIKISLLNDKWDARDTNKLRSTLEALLPPRDQRDFNIFVYDYRLGNKGDWVDNFPPDEFDYMLRASVQQDGNVSITINRQEIDAVRIPKSVYQLPGMDQPGYRQKDFEKGEIKYSKSISDLVKKEDSLKLDDYLAIGPFTFTLYYFKLSNPTKENLEKYPQKTFDVKRRRRWVQASGGIRLYRDNFRVRPYGEPNTQGADWLLLGQRTAANPAAVSRMGWRVPPQQVAGTIHITKKYNSLLADQSNREGIMNERAFSAFRSLVLAIIAEFEYDRSYIYRRFDRAYQLDHPKLQVYEEGLTAAEKVLAEPQTQHNFVAIEIAKAFNVSIEKNNELREEVNVLRGMATLGTVLVSFTHELRQIKANMDVRQRRMQNALSRVIDAEKLKTVQSEVNPYNLLERWGREDEKVSRWVDFALFSVAPAKRRRQQIVLTSYLAELATHWAPYLEAKKAFLIITPNSDDTIKLLAHEIDLDSVFYNLIVNSVEAFVRPGSPNIRNIVISITSLPIEAVRIEYRDTGPGLDKSFRIPEDIFEFGVSSKSSAISGEVTGTGLGMWLLKSIIDDYRGSAFVVSKIGEQNFGIDLILPIIKPSEG